jgi:hypothetical protein
MQVKLISPYHFLSTFLFSLISRGIRNTVVSDRLNVFKGLKGTNQIIGFERG